LTERPDTSRSISELSRQVAVDFETDADFHECGGCPLHFIFLMFLERTEYISSILLGHGHRAGPGD
jgi:hypothetical protein